MEKLIYRRENISLALDNGKNISGCNLWVWYGYKQAECNRSKNYIVDAKEIKKDMKEDMILYDHVCISLMNIDGFINMIIEIGKKIFDIAKKHKMLSEIIIEDIYGDVIIINHVSLCLQLKALFDSKKAKYYFLFENEIDRVMCFGKDLKPVTLTYCNNNPNRVKNYLSDRLYEDDNTLPYITETDVASGIAYSHLANSNQVRYYTILCKEHLSHYLPDMSHSNKCGRLHGHSYCCIVTVQNLFGIDFLESLNKLAKETHRLLNDSISKNKVEISTLENVVNYIYEGLANDYRIVSIKLYETPNIQTRIYNF